jgi:hypothetical protein
VCVRSREEGIGKMDIDDILREADPGLVEVAVGISDLQALTRAWVAERSAPEILEWVSLSLSLCFLLSFSVPLRGLWVGTWRWG